MYSIPAQYQRGWVEFYKLKFKVSADVLIPRPETELLVDEVIRMANGRRQMADGQKDKIIRHTPRAIRILDVGTGSGNIAISIAKNLKNIRIVATDVSKKALEVARQNAKLHGVDDRIEFLESDLMSFWGNSHPEAPSEGSLDSSASLQNDHLNRFDIIVTNLPYIPTARIPYLDSSVKDYEPHVALDGGEDGFELYRKLFAQLAKRHPEASSEGPTRSLTPNASAHRRSLDSSASLQNDKDERGKDKSRLKYLIGEIDYTQGEIAQNEANKYFPGAQAEIKFDLAHKQRFLEIKF